MIISSEHHELLEQFKKANEIEAEAIKIMSDYTTTPNPDKATAMLLFKKFEEAHERKMQIYSELKKHDLSQPSQ